MYLPPLLLLIWYTGCFGLHHLKCKWRMQQHLSMTSLPHSSDVLVVVNGLPGDMALETAKACIDRGLTIAPIALTSPNYSPQCVEIKVDVKHENISTGTLIASFLLMCMTVCLVSIYLFVGTIFHCYSRTSTKFFTKCGNKTVE